MVDGVIVALIAYVQLGLTLLLLFMEFFVAYGGGAPSACDAVPPRRSGQRVRAVVAKAEGADCGGGLAGHFCGGIAGRRHASRQSYG